MEAKIEQNICVHFDAYMNKNRHHNKLRASPPSETMSLFVEILQDKQRLTKWLKKLLPMGGLPLRFIYIYIYIHVS